jgi:formylglycine-generating enzyme required for sulfatase activity
VTDGGTKAGGKGDWTGRVLEGRYRVERVLGSGGMGTAYLARDERMQRPVVVKVPHARLLDDEQFRARFIKEIRSLTSLPHPHVVTVLDAGEAVEAGRDESIPFAVLAYLEGGSLRDRLEKSLQAPDEVLGWLPDVAKALDFIHGEGVVHRDVKPGNILFDRKGNAVLADFGIAKALGSLDTGLTRTGFTPGSPPYMGPEVGMGLPLGPGYDQYALGVLVYEALSGVLPHEGTSGEVLIAKKAYVDPIDLAKKAANVPVAARAAVMKAIARKPEDRFASCRAFADAFAFGVRPPIPETPPSTVSRRPTLGLPPTPTPTPAPKHANPVGWRAVRWAAVVVGLLALLGGAAFLAFGRDGGAGRTPPVLTTILVVESPLEGAIVSKDEVQVAGQAAGPAEAVLAIDGEPVAVKDGRFSTKLTLGADGDRTIEVTFGAPSEPRRRVASRRIEVDRTKPTLTITKPIDRSVAFDATSVTIEGIVRDRHPDRVTGIADEPSVPVREDGTFIMPNLPLTSGLGFMLFASDKGGLLSETVYVQFTRNPKPPDAPATQPDPPWKAPLDAAKAAASANPPEWEAAATSLADAKAKGAPAIAIPATLSEGLDAYGRAPVFEITEPVDGATVSAASVRVRGTLREGRATDEVKVNGTSVHTGVGDFVTSVAFDKPGRYRVTVAVEDRGTGRGAPVTRTVTRAAPAPAVAPKPSWAKTSSEQDEYAEAQGLPVALENSIGMRFVLIPPGKFTMGSPDGETGHELENEPQHRVEISKRYYMAICETTNRQYRRFKKDHDSGDHFNGDDQPVVQVGLDDATGFVGWLNGQEAGKTYRLPTEAEWEYACRARTTTPFSFGATIDSSKANYNGSFAYEGGATSEDRHKTVVVGSLPANVWGLYEMHGNAAEWVADRWSHFGAGTSIDPTGPASGEGYVTRGGAWSDEPVYVRSAYRAWSARYSHGYQEGFRVTVSATPLR